MDTIGDYELVRPVGDGNYGRFYLARPPARLHLDAEHVVVKVLEGATDGDAERRLLLARREIGAFARVRSPHLVTILDAGQQGSAFYYAIEHLPLGSLAAPVHPLERSEIVRAVAHAARAAHALHEAGIVHRDITPTNVLLHEGGAKLGDLGLHQYLEPGQTVTSQPSLAAFEFTDPAVISGERPSRASDIWSLGSTLHRALSGSGLYGERKSTALISKMLSSPPTIDETVGQDAAEVIASCLSPDAMARPLTAEALAERLDSLT